MSVINDHPGRILVIARAALARRMTAALAPVGYEIHHSPYLDLSRLRWPFAPNLVMVSLDLPWLDPLALAGALAGMRGVIPVLLLAGAGDAPPSEWPHAPADADPASLRALVADVLANGSPRAGAFLDGTAPLAS